MDMMSADSTGNAFLASSRVDEMKLGLKRQPLLD